MGTWWRFRHLITSPHTRCPSSPSHSSSLLVNTLECSIWPALRWLRPLATARHLGSPITNSLCLPINSEQLKTFYKACTVVQWVKPPRATLASHSTVLVWVLVASIPCQLPNTPTGLPGPRLGDSDGVPGSWCRPGLASAVVRTWGLNQQMENLSLFLSLEIYLANKKAAVKILLFFPYIPTYWDGKCLSHTAYHTGGDAERDSSSLLLSQTSGQFPKQSSATIGQWFGFV